MGAQVCLKHSGHRVKRVFYVHGRVKSLKSINRVRILIWAWGYYYKSLSHENDSHLVLRLSLVAMWKVDGRRTAGGRETSCRDLGSAFDSLSHLGVWIRSQEVSFSLIKDWKSCKSRSEASSSHRLREGRFDSGYLVLRKRDQSFLSNCHCFVFCFLFTRS